MNGENKRIRMRGGGALLSVDHCFSIKGQGTVMTGTVLQVGKIFIDGKSF